MQMDEKEYVVRTVMKINTEMSGAYVFSSGKNMGTFKAVGYPEDIGAFYKLDEYQGYSWTAHGRYLSLIHIYLPAYSFQIIPTYIFDFCNITVAGKATIFIIISRRKRHDFLR